MTKADPTLSTNSPNTITCQSNPQLMRSRCNANSAEWVGMRAKVWRYNRAQKANLSLQEMCTGLGTACEFQIPLSLYLNEYTEPFKCAYHFLKPLETYY